MRRRHEGTTTERGYGYTHQQARRRWKRIVDAGDAFCGRCRGWINPDEPWDLAHPGDDKGNPPVPWHRWCNREFAVTVTRPRRNGKPVPARITSRRRHSRDW